MKQLSPIAKVTKLYGLNGGLVLSLYDTFSDDINLEEPLFVLIDNLAAPLFIDAFERRGKSGALVTFADIDNEIRATELIGLEVMVPKGVLSEDEFEDEDGELFFDDLVGYRAIICEDEDEGAVQKVEGEITDFIDDEQNPLLVVEVDGSEVLIPASDDFIESIDVDNQVLEMTIPAGLLELYL